jgi:archaellum component FlaC
MAQKDFKVKNGIVFGGNLSSNTSGLVFDYTSNALSVGGEALALQANVNSVASNVSTVITNLNTVSSNVNSITSDLTIISGNVNSIASNVDTISSNVNSIASNVSTVITNLNTVSSNVDAVASDLVDFGSYANTTFTTNAHIDTKIGELIDSAPGTLDTLNELAAALGDDPNFATTITNSINTISTNVNTVSSNVDSLSSAVDTVTNNVNTVSSNVDAIIDGSTAFTGEVSFAGINTTYIELDSVANTSGELATSVGSGSTSIFTFAGSEYRGAELTVLVQDITTSEYQVSKILVVHDGNEVYTTEYGVLHTGSTDLNTFSASIDGSDVVTVTSTGGSANKKISVISNLLLQ